MATHPAPCVECGVDSVATCNTCHRRVCNAHMVMSAGRVYVSSGIYMTDPVRLVHPVGETDVKQSDGTWLTGFTSGPARCHACRVSDGDEAVRRLEQENAACAARVTDARTRLPAATNPRDIVQLLAAGGRELDPDDCCAAWVKLVASGVVEPHDMELVRVRFGRSIFRDLVSELWRRRAWIYETADGRRWLDESGASWSEDTRFNIERGRQGTEERTFLVRPQHPALMRSWVRKRATSDGTNSRERCWEMPGGSRMNEPGVNPAVIAGVAGGRALLKT